MKPFSWRFVRCLWTVASDDRLNRRPISSRLGRVAVLLDELLQVVQNLALAFGQWLHVSLRKSRAKARGDYTQKNNGR